MNAELVVGCFTAGDYAKEAHDVLIASVEKLGITYVVREIPNRGSWVLNNSACQLYLRELDIEFPHADFLYIDVDGYVHSDPWPFLRTLKGCDLACHYMSRPGWNYGMRGTRFVDEELLSGTVYWPAGPRRRELLVKWTEENAANPGDWDQRNLQYLLWLDPSIKCARLPVEYTFIFDIHRQRHPDAVPVVEHMQASRRYRHRVVPS